MKGDEPEHHPVRSRSSKGHLNHTIGLLLSLGVSSLSCLGTKPRWTRSYPEMCGCGFGVDFFGMNTS